MPLRAGRIHCLPRLADWVASFSHGRVSTGTAGYSAVGTATASVAGRFSVSGGFEVMVDCDADTDYCSPADIGVTSNAVFSMQGTSTINTPFGIPVSGRVSINVTAAVWPDSPERQAAGYEQRRAQSARRHACAITHQARMREHSPSAVRSIALGAQVSHGRHARSEHVQPDARLPRQRGAYLCTPSCHRLDPRPAKSTARAWDGCIGACHQCMVLGRLQRRHWQQQSGGLFGQLHQLSPPRASLARVWR